MGYNEYGSMASHRAVDDGTVRGARPVDVVELDRGITAYPGRVAGEVVLPPLPSE